MIITANAFVDRVNFVFEKLQRGVPKYAEASITEEKFAIAQKLLWCGRPCRSAGRCVA